MTHRSSELPENPSPVSGTSRSAASVVFEFIYIYLTIFSPGAHEHVPFLIDHTLIGILMRQACEAVPVKGHYDRGLWECVEGGDGVNDPPFREGVVGGKAWCPESPPYSEGTGGTGGYVPSGG